MPSNTVTRNYKTTAMGAMALLAALFTGGYQFLAGEITMPAMATTVTAFITGMGLLFARDAKSTDRVDDE